MNIALWVLQVLLAFFSLAGGAFKAFSSEKLPQIPAITALPMAAWIGFGIFEMICAIGLLLPGTFAPNAIFTAACALAVENLLLAGYYVYQLQPGGSLMSPQYPFMWVLLGGVLAALIAYGRMPQ